MNSLSRHSVLVVEDERIIARDIQQTLGEIGYDAYATAATAEEAIARASERCPDAVLMDIRIKGERDGVETAQLLKSRFGIPVVFLTAHADSTTLERAKRAEPYGYLMKPVKAAELRSAIEVAVYKHRLDKQLRERERWFSTTLQSIGDAVISVDLAGIVTYVNPAAETLIGLKSSYIVGKAARDILLLSNQVPASPDATPLATVLRTQQPFDLEDASLYNPTTGLQRSISDSTTPVVDEGKMLGAVMVFRDVTERKVLQRQLELADRLASLGTMAAGAAHELKNPLAVVMTNADFVSELLLKHRADLFSGSSPEVLDDGLLRISAVLGDMQAAASRMGRIVSDLKSFSRPAEQSAGVVDLVDCLELAIRATQQEFRHRARVVTQFDGRLRVDADEARLQQVFVNLLVNAAQAIAPGHVDRNEVRVMARAMNEQRIAVEIQDTGSGIPDEVKRRIFEPFFTTKDVGVGTGLGLSICQGLVTAMGGEIEVESEPGTGTTFRVLLPAAAADRDRQGANAAAKPAVNRRGRILVVDDEPLLLEAIQGILEVDDHQVIVTETPREALAMLERGERFDIILSDVMMPMMTGVEFYEALLARYPDTAPRVIFMSGGSISPRIDAFLNSVSNVRIEKPFRINTLREIIQQALLAHSESSHSTLVPPVPAGDNR